jgi:hypothetical protein
MRHKLKLVMDPHAGTYQVFCSHCHMLTSPVATGVAAWQEWLRFSRPRPTLSSRRFSPRRELIGDHYQASVSTYKDDLQRLV